VLSSVHITTTEEKLLLQHYSKSHCKGIRERAHAVMLSNQGFTPVAIAKILFHKEKAIREWLKAFEKERTASLFPKYIGNEHAAKLTKQQKQSLKQVLAKKPSTFGIPQEFWDIASLKRYIKAEFGVEYESDESYRLIFLLHNYSFHLPQTFDRHRNEGQVKKRIVEIKQEIKPFMKDDKWIVFVSDECRIIWETEIRRLWLPKGEKSVIKVERKRKAQSFLGFLTLKNGEELLYRLSWQKQDEIIPVLEKLVKKYPKKRICIIWDNARFHHGKKLREKLKTTLGSIHLINLPAYAPDHNPQEHVWEYGKGELANNQRESLEETALAFEKIITGRIYDYHF